MTITEFLTNVGFKPYGSVVNSWDSFNDARSVLMQLWQEPGQRVRDHAVAGAYLRVRCFDATHYSNEGKSHAVGYAGRLLAIKSLEAGMKGYVALSSPPGGKRGPGVWAKHADLAKVYPVLAVERPDNTPDVFVILGNPIATSAIS
jgi:hypothetical protein